MSKAPPPYDDEIYFFELFETLWDGKSKIILTTFVAAVIGVVFSIIKPNSFEVTTTIQNGKPDVFIQYTSLNEVLKSNGFNEPLTADSVFSEFVVEFNDYEEMVDVVNTSEFVQKSIKDLDDVDKQRALINFAKAFKLQPPSKNKKDWTMSFEWHDDLEGMRLFNNAIHQTLLSTKNHKIYTLNELATAIDVRNKLELEKLRIKLSVIKENQIDRSKKQMKYLTEQSSIAKELGIETNRLDGNSLTQSYQNAISFNVSSVDIPYYLRGFKAIDKEIELIQSRSDLDNLLNAENYIEVKEKIYLLEKDLSSSQLRNISEVLENDNPNYWVEFNLVIADVESKKKLMLNLALSIVLGGMVGAIYVFASNAIRKRKKSSAKA